MQGNGVRGVWVCGVAMTLLLVTGLSVAKAQRPVRIDTNKSSEPGNRSSYRPVLNSNGRFVAFVSSASNLIAGDTNRLTDVFVKDLQSGQVKLASSSSAGEAGNHYSGGSVSAYVGRFLSEPIKLSGDGRFVAFSSEANNLAAGDTYGNSIFIKDLQSGEIKVASSSYLFSLALSSNGQFVAFGTSSAPGQDRNIVNVLVKNLQNGKVRLASSNRSGKPGGKGAYPDSDAKDLSEDGRFVAFTSGASNLINQNTHGHINVFVKDLQTGNIELASSSGSGRPGNKSIDDDATHPVALSGSGRFIAFGSNASNLVPGDTNGLQDVFVKDLRTGKIKLISSNQAGKPGNHSSHSPALSGDGRFVVFASSASNLVASDRNDLADVFIKDLRTGRIRKITQQKANQVYYSTPAISRDGHKVVFASYRQGRYGLISVFRGLFMTDNPFLSPSLSKS